ncbi:uncharacterized protein [Notamacropus eugenii]|uniref:uncharacterized protein n=1 Tax=Notamacropus eugenii TaxID=9315 RepID=UPI003B676031
MKKKDRRPGAAASSGSSMNAHLLVRFALLGALAPLIQMKEKAAPDLVTLECLGSLSRLTFNGTFFKNKYLDFYAVDQFGTTRKIDEALANQCGYTIASDAWGNVDFRASLLSCYSVIKNDVSFTVTVEVHVASDPQRTEVTVYQRSVSCSHSSWYPREIVCEANYMEVSVKREVPFIPADMLQDEPEDWAAAFPEATSGMTSIWQIVFHTLTGRRVMLVSDAHSAGYGINMTDTRILLRAGFNAQEAQQVEIQGVTFSAIRSSTFYKQHWMIFMVDTAVACPTDDMVYTEDMIIWTMPKNIGPLLMGASNVKDLSVEMGVGLHKLTAADLISRRYSLRSDGDTINITVPIGAEGGYYKTHVQSGHYGTSYHIALFLEHRWEDDKWGVTKHTVVKTVRTPLQLQEPILTNNTNPNLRIFNISVGTFLPDVELISLTMNNQTVLVPVANKSHLQIYEALHANGSRDFIIEIGFHMPGVDIEYPGEDFRIYTLNASLLLRAGDDVFTTPVMMVSIVHDVVLPKVEGHCDAENLYLELTRGNVDQSWVPFLLNTRLTPEAAQKYNYDFHDNGTHLVIRVPYFSAHVVYEDISPSGIRACLQLKMKNNRTLANMREYSITCPFSPKDLIACQANGSMVVTALILAGVPSLDPSRFVLRDKRCGPVLVNKTSATFVFGVNTCGTSRKFEEHTLTYENDVLFFSPGLDDPIYRLQCTCRYPINETTTVRYRPEKSQVPGSKPGHGRLALIMKLSKDGTYSEFYKEDEYPVHKYLRDSLLFEVELLHWENLQVELFLEDCWATTSQDGESQPRWDIIIDSCPSDEDFHETIFHPVDVGLFPHHLKRYEVKMFAFMKDQRALLEDVYFHCSVVLCRTQQPDLDSLCARSCIPGKQRVGRSTRPYHSQGLVSSGAISLTTANRH